MNLTNQNKEQYRKLCEEKDIPLFMQAWWMDAVCVDGKMWDVLLYEEDGKIIGAMPYHLRKKWGFRAIVQPQQTQFNGIWIDYPSEQKLHKRYSYERKIMDSFITQLDEMKLSYYSQNFHHSFTNWQPFYWKGFKQTTRYTFVIKDISNLDIVFENIHTRYRQKIKKGETELSIDFNLSPKDFYHFHKTSLQSKQKNSLITYSESLFNSIYIAADKRDQGKIIAVRDKSKSLLAALFFVWDKQTAYHLIPVKNFDQNINYISEYMIWETIKYVRTKTKSYDFEGSMTEGISYINQKFGAEQVPYFNISKSYSPIFSFLNRTKNGKS